jgi:hypothetical protein
MAGYGEGQARGDLERFLASVDRPRGIHLCGNPDWDFLLALDMEILSLDIYSNGEVFAAYAPALRRFLERGGRIVWGLVPTNQEPFFRETSAGLERRLENLWTALGRRGVDRELLVSRSLLSPATCCLVNADGERTVEAAFAMVRELSARMRERLALPG